MSTWNDFNDAPAQSEYDLIPKGTLAKVRMTIKPGAFDDPARGWTGGYATRNAETGSVYLSAEFVILEGPYARRKVWSLIGLHSPKGDEWANMGRAFVRALLNSARGLSPKDDSPAAQNARRIKGFADLDGIEFVAKIDVEKDQRGDLKNVVKTAIQADHKDYAALIGTPRAAPAANGGTAATATAYAQATGRAATPARPTWAQ